jgi:diguanylate cyclase (GGDEF)-like protein
MHRTTPSRHHNLPHASGRAVIATLQLWAAPLPTPLRAGFDSQVDSNIAQLLPVLGPVCGGLVLLFAVWDAWIDPVHAATTLRIRVAMVLLGSLAYGQRRLRWNAGWRCAWVYVTHAGAMAICSALLLQGPVLALPGMTGTLFLLALVEPRPRRFVLATLPPSLLLAVLAAASMPRPLLLNTLLLYALSWPMALWVALAHLRMRRRAFLAEQALLDAVRHDSLSGALSRGYVTDLAMHDVALAQRHGRPLALVMLDIDWFKRVNDTYGHASGDRALCALVEACKSCLRASDYVGRIGGEEFVCVMPETGPAAALACAERIRLAVASLCLPTDAGPLRFTVSAGVAVLDHRIAAWPALLRAADAALYQAKSAGRNRSVLAPAPVAQPRDDGPRAA